VPNNRSIYVVQQCGPWRQLRDMGRIAYVLLDPRRHSFDVARNVLDVRFERLP
jgi:hypothetical protein